MGLVTRTPRAGRIRRARDSWTPCRRRVHPVRRAARGRTRDPARGPSRLWRTSAALAADSWHKNGMLAVTSIRLDVLLDGSERTGDRTVTPSRRDHDEVVGRAPEGPLRRHARGGRRLAAINRGEIFGILGPNGAGKTTTVECIGGLRKPDAGSISVLGLDVRTPRQGAARARRDPAPDLGAARTRSTCARRSSCSPRSTRTRSSPTELLQHARPRGEGRHPLRQPLRRPAPAPVDRARAGRPSRSSRSSTS